MNDCDSFPNTICQLCVNRILEFDVWCNEVTQHQEYLHASSHSIPSSSSVEHVSGNEAQLIQLTPAFMSKSDGSLLIFQTTISSNAMNSLELHHLIPNALIDESNSNDNIKINGKESNDFIDESVVSNVIKLTSSEILIKNNDQESSQTSEHDNSHVKLAETMRSDCGVNSVESNHSTATLNYANSVIIERELSQIESDDISIDARDDNFNDEDDDENEYEDCEDNDCSKYTKNDIDESNMNHVRFSEFPTVMINDSKLIFKGKELLELMTKFYKLECDRCIGIR